MPPIELHASDFRKHVKKEDSPACQKILQGYEARDSEGPQIIFYPQNSAPLQIHFFTEGSSRAQGVGMEQQFYIRIDTSLLESPLIFHAHFQPWGLPEMHCDAEGFLVNLRLSPQAGRVVAEIHPKRQMEEGEIVAIMSPPITFLSAFVDVFYRLRMF